MRKGIYMTSSEKGKLYGKFLGKEIIWSVLIKGIYKWKKANVVPVHKKDSKHFLKNYRPISLLPICGKIFEKCNL